MNQLNLYLDDTDLHSPRHEAKDTDVRAIGGVLIPCVKVPQLIKRIEEMKNDYGLARVPVKWNKKDVRTLLHQADKLEVYKKWVEYEHEIKSRMFDLAFEHDAKLVVNVIQAYKRKTVKVNRDDLTRFLITMQVRQFSRILSQEKSYGRIIMDWPGKDPSLITKEDASLYTKSKSTSGVNCPEIKSERLEDSVLFAKSNHHIPIQLADMTVGFFRSALDASFKDKHPSSNNRNVFNLLMPQFYKAKSGRQIGINIDNNSTDLKKRFDALTQSYT